MFQESVGLRLWGFSDLHSFRLKFSNQAPMTAGLLKSRSLCPILQVEESIVIVGLDALANVTTNSQQTVDLVA